MRPIDSGSTNGSGKRPWSWHNILVAALPSKRSAGTAGFWWPIPAMLTAALHPARKNLRFFRSRSHYRVMPTLGIVTISFNQARFLTECIESVKLSDLSRLRYVIVDPGSTDGSRDLIEKYRDRFSAIRSPQVRGVRLQCFST